MTISISFTLPDRGTRRRLILTAILAMALAIPSGAFASHLFTDVPDSNTFHDNIANLATAGVTTGCSPTTYCPDDPVSRGQMAAFLNRGLGRSAMSAFATGVTGTDPATVGAISIRPGMTAAAVPGAKQFVLVNVAGTLSMGTPSGCPCDITLNVDGATYYIPVVTVSSAGYYPISATAVVSFDTPGTKTIYVKADVFGGGDGSTAYTMSGTITAVTVPFGSLGTSVASPGRAPASGGAKGPTAD